MTRSASPAWSRDCSSLHVSVTIPATFRLGAGNAPAATPGGASPSWYPAAPASDRDTTLSNSNARTADIFGNAPSRGGVTSPSRASFTPLPPLPPRWPGGEGRVRGAVGQGRGSAHPTFRRRAPLPPPPDGAAAGRRGDSG